VISGIKEINHLIALLKIGHTAGQCRLLAT